MLNAVGVEHIQQQMCWSGFGFEEREMDLREIEKEERCDWSRFGVDWV